MLEGLREHPAVKAVVAWNAEALTDAKFDFGELTLTIAPEAIREACAALKAAGYNSFDDLTAVDWFPAAPRFQLSYHLLSYGMKERIRLRVIAGRRDPGGGVDYARMAGGELLRARGLRPVRSAI